MPSAPSMEDAEKTQEVDRRLLIPLKARCLAAVTELRGNPVGDASLCLALAYLGIELARELDPGSVFVNGASGPVALAGDPAIVAGLARSAAALDAPGVTIARIKLAELAISDFERRRRGRALGLSETGALVACVDVVERLARGLAQETGAVERALRLTLVALGVPRDQWPEVVR
jgi:hypothetical protein